MENLRLMATYELMEGLARYTGFGEEDARVLERCRPLLEPAFDGVVDSFYEAIEADEGARSVFADDAQIARQKKFLRAWLDGVFGGVYDAAYFELRARIGRAHVRIQLAQHYMVAAMNRVRTGLHAAATRNLTANGWSIEDVLVAHCAIDRICDLELAIMLETYREDYIGKIRSTEKLATLGQLAATIGHELRNPLAVMETSLHLLAPRVREDAKAERHVARLGQQVALCSSIIGDLLDMARDRAPDRKDVAIGPLVEDALRDVFGAGEAVREILPSPDAVVNVDPLQIRQLLVNLVTNALQAAGSGPPGVRVHVEVRDDGDFVLRVEDDGAGLSDEVMSRLFEPLFTTRTRGVGLGLALCRRVAEKHGGSIRAANRPEGGAVFEVLIPPARKNS